jgi:hypothetical protein
MVDGLPAAGLMALDCPQPAAALLAVVVAEVRGG